MRTTIDINDELLSAAKARAVSQGRSLKSVVEDALREALSDSGRAGRAKRPKIPTFAGKGLQPGVDLLDNAALEALMNADR